MSVQSHTPMAGRVSAAPGFPLPPALPRSSVPCPLTALSVTGLAVPIAGAEHTRAIGPETRGLPPKAGETCLAELTPVACWAGAHLHPVGRDPRPRPGTGQGDIVQIASTWEREDREGGCCVHLGPDYSPACIGVRDGRRASGISALSAGNSKVVGSHVHTHDHIHASTCIHRTTGR